MERTIQVHQSQNYIKENVNDPTPLQENMTIHEKVNDPLVRVFWVFFFQQNSANLALCRVSGPVCSVVHSYLQYQGYRSKRSFWWHLQKPPIYDIWTTICNASLTKARNPWIHLHRSSVYNPANSWWPFLDIRYLIWHLQEKKLWMMAV